MININKQSTCFFTGHRNIPAKNRENIAAGLMNSVTYLILRKHVTSFISGGALGFDTMAVNTVLQLKELYPSIKLYMYLPCTDQDEKWNKRDREIYRHILSCADENIYITHEKYKNGCMKQRNLAMAQSSSYCIAYYTGRSSGTGQSIRFADENGCEIINTASVSDMDKMRFEMIKARLRGEYI